MADAGAVGDAAGLGGAGVGEEKGAGVPERPGGAEGVGRHGELLSPGDPVAHAHALPQVPQYEIPGWIEGTTLWRDRINAVARCTVCGQLFVSREDPDGWGPHARWVPLRWWHFRAKRLLRQQGMSG